MDDTLGHNRSCTDHSPLISVVVPVKDEEEVIAAFVERTSRVLCGLREDDGTTPAPWEILFVDDGSRDATLAAIAAANAKDSRVRGISLSRNFGKEAALSAGLDSARGRTVIPIDVDMQDPPEVIPEMIAKWREGFEIINGVRTNRETDSLPKRITANWYYSAHNWLAHDKIPEHAGDFRLLDEKVVDVIREMPERNRFMKGLFAWSGFRQAVVEYRRVPREMGSTKFNYWKLWTLALDGITSSSTVPLRVWSYLGGLIALVALAFAVFIIVRTMIFGIDTPGYASLMTAILAFGGLQLLSLGILGEYVGRILIETKRRPLYVIRERIGD